MGRKDESVAGDRVKYSYGLTLSLGERTFEFVRLDVGMESNVAVGESVEDAFNRVAEIVERLLTQKAAEVK